MDISRGIAEHERERVAELFVESFSEQLGGTFGPPQTALRFIARSLRIESVICARDCSGHIIGVAGFHNSTGATLSFDYRSLQVEFGYLSAAIRLFKLALMDHRAHPTNFAIEGICVDKGLRNRGIGRKIVEALAHEAKAQGCIALSLKVLNSNTSARKLYESCGFITWRRRSFWPMPNLERATLMVRYLD